MKVELIKSERLTYGNFRYRVQVRRGVFGWHSVYLAKNSVLGLEWYTGHAQERVWSEPLISTLTTILREALAANQCQPQALPFAVVPCAKAL